MSNYNNNSCYECPKCGSQIPKNVFVAHVNTCFPNTNKKLFLSGKRKEQVRQPPVARKPTSRIQTQFFSAMNNSSSSKRSKLNKAKSRRIQIQTTIAEPPTVPPDAGYSYSIENCLQSTYNYKNFVGCVTTNINHPSYASLSPSNIPKELRSQLHQPNCSMDSGELKAMEACGSNEENHQRQHSSGIENETVDNDVEEDEQEFFRIHDSDSSQGSDNEAEVARRQPAATSNSSCDLLLAIKHQAPHVEDIAYSPRQRFWLELAGILQDTNTPKYLYKDISKWAVQLIENPEYTTGCTPSLGYTDLVTQMAKHHGMKGIRPTNEILRLPGSLHSVSVVKFDFMQQIFSLLSDTKLMSPENLIWGDYLPNKRLEKTGFLGDIHTSNWYLRTQEQLCTGPLDVLIPIYLFIDKSFAKGHSWEPTSMTLGIFWRMIRQTPEAWRHLGFIPGLLDKLVGLDEDAAKADQARIKTVDYHFVLRYILSDIIDLERYKDGVKWDFGDGTTYNLKFAIVNVIGDIEGFDKLNGRKRSHRGSAMTFSCDIKRENCMDPYAPCTFHRFDDLNTLQNKSFDYSNTENPAFSAEETKEAREKLNQHFFYHGIRNAFSGINFGANDNGLNSACCVCLMHTFKEKFPDLLVDLFLMTLGKTEDTIGKLQIETSMPRLIAKIRKQSDRNYPKISKFAFRLTKGQIKYDANQKYARVFALYIYSLTTSCRNLITGEGRYKIPMDRMIKLSKLLEESLTIYEYMYQEKFPRELVENKAFGSDFLKAATPIQEFLVNYNDMLEEISPSSETNVHSIFPKLHYLIHVVQNILEYGSSRNFDGGASESNFKQLAKKPARRTQGRADSIDIQLCNNYIDELILRKALDHSMIKEYASKHLKSSDQDNIDEAGSDLDSDDDSEDGCYDEMPNRNCKTTINCRSTRVIIRFTDNESKVEVDVKQGNKKFTRPYPATCLEAVYRILIDSEPRQLLDNLVDGFTCLSRKGLIYRAHPSYRSGQEWYDYANFRWQVDEGEEIDVTTPGQRRLQAGQEVMTYDSMARIYMFLDLRNSRLCENSAYDNDLYALVKSVELDDNNTGPTEEAWQHWEHSGSPRIARHWTLEDGYRLVKAKFISSPCFGFEDYSDSNMINRTGYVIEVKPFNEWKYVHNESLGCSPEDRYD